MRTLVPAAPGPRLAAVAAVGAVVVAGYLWLGQVVVPGGGGLPFGCGSPSYPNRAGLARSVCDPALDGRRSSAVVAICLAVALLVLARAADVLVRRGKRDVLALPVAVGASLVATGVAVLVQPLQARSADGTTVVRCGSALMRTGDSFAAGLCADLPDSRLALAVALGTGGLVALVGGLWAAAAHRPPVLPADAAAAQDAGAAT